MKALGNLRFQAGVERMTNDEKSRVVSAIMDLLTIVSHTNVPTAVMREFENRNAQLLTELITGKATDNMRVIGFAPGTRQQEVN